MPRYRIESFERMKEARNLPFLKRNMRVIVDGEPGRVVANYGFSLWVKFDGNKHGCNCHPHWRVTYLDEQDNVIKVYGD